MAQEFSKSLYNSKQWQETRKAYAKSVKGLCEDCLAKGIYTAGDIVHHRKPLTPENINDPQITLSWDNLKLVCRSCHALEHKTVDVCYFFDDEGNIVMK